MSAFAFDDSGLIPPAAEELAKADEGSGILVYLTGVTEDKTPYYAYLAVKPSRYSEFCDKSDAGKPIIPAEYGEVIASGFESSAPPEVISRMQTEYGFDEHLLEKLRTGVIAEYKVFLKKREDQHINDLVAIMKKQQTSGE